MRGSRGGSGPWNLQSLISPILLEMKEIVIFIFVHFHSYTSKRINPQNNNQITSGPIQEFLCVCVMGFFLHKVGPPWKNFLDPRLLLVMAGVTILYSLYYYLLYHDRVRCTFN